jgi:hypothetical protein
MLSTGVNWTMSSRYANVIAFSHLSAVLIVIAGCNGRGRALQTGVDAPGTVDGQPVPVAFVACPMQQAFDGDSVNLLVGVRNLGADDQMLITSLDVMGGLGVTVTDPRGRQLHPMNSWEPADAPPGRPTLGQYLLPRGGIMGRVINLACDAMEPGGLVMPQCVPLYSFAERGRYTVRLEHRGTSWCPAPCDPDSAGTVHEERLLFPPVTLHIRIR